MERHKATQSHANGTTMGRFPRLTPVRLSPQVPDHMTVSLSLCSVHCIAADSDSYKYPALASPKGRQIGPCSPFFCVCFRATAAPSVSSRLCSLSLVPCPTRSRLSPLATVTCEPVRSAQLTISSPSRLDRCPVTHTCGSGNNKPRTPLPVTLARVPSSGTSRGFILYCALQNSRADSHSAIHSDRRYVRCNIPSGNWQQFGLFDVRSDWS